ncbi:Mitoferrin-1 isoform A [Fasciola gigantica]|uniref:Mitoferrin-1 isoform A n=1 Tax=Fasciola gigantica TaxID=46835 RepID=A0A504Y4P0_FASGI|nr:Mitoferrin-1 isoform A [Fasciola gigantica]
MMAGAVAGIMEHIVMYPVDSVKTRMQCLRPMNNPCYPNVISGLARLVRAEGIRGSLRGVGAMVGGAGPAHAAYFGCYEQVKKSVEGSTKFSSLAPLVGGACATFLHDAVMTPADAVKQRLQIFNSPYHNSLDCFLHVIRIEGPSALYRAYFTQLTMNVPYQAIHFVTYEAAQDIVNPSRLYRPWTHMFSGGLAGCLAAALTNPLDVCKTALNTQERMSLTSTKDNRIHGLRGAARIVYRLDGVRGFTRGLGARILTAVPGTAISWSVYEYFKWFFKNEPAAPDAGPESRSDNCISTLPVFLPVSSEVSCAVAQISSRNREPLTDSIPNSGE